MGILLIIGIYLLSIDASIVESDGTYILWPALQALSTQTCWKFCHPNLKKIIKIK